VSGTSSRWEYAALKGVQAGDTMMRIGHNQDMLPSSVGNGGWNNRRTTRDPQHNNWGINDVIDGLSLLHK
jgi:hypothetical protein